MTELEPARYLWTHGLYFLLSQAYYFDRDDQALHNFAKFFKNQSHEEREHAEKLMKVQNQRGGRIFLQDVKVIVCAPMFRLLGNACFQREFSMGIW